MVAIGSDAAGVLGTFVGVKVGGAAWGGNIGNTAAAIAATTTTGDIAFPTDFNITTNPNFFFGIDDTANVAEGVYMFQGVPFPGASVATATPSVAAANDVVSIDVSGAFAASVIVAGVQNGRVLRSLNGGSVWTPILKAPSGATQAWVAIDAADATKMLALVNGANGGLSVSTDSGTTWNQISLIAITLAVTTPDVINDLSVDSDGTVFMSVTDAAQGFDSIFRWDGTNWDRIFTETVPGADNMALVEMSPDVSAVFV
jgi:hypothetical protein